MSRTFFPHIEGRVELTVGQRIRDARDRLARRTGERVTQEWLAGRVGVSKGTVAKWETDVQAPAGDNLLALAAALQVEAAELAGKGTSVLRESPPLYGPSTMAEAWRLAEGEAAKIRAQALLREAEAAVGRIATTGLSSDVETVRPLLEQILAEIRRGLDGSA